jgi:Txe/YoeB family toxin of toxin-antitoxin system
VNYELFYTRQARKDSKKLKGSPLASKAKELLALISDNPWIDPPLFEALVGDLKGAYSRRINIQHRIVYQVLEAKSMIKVLRLWTHYE